VSPRKAKSGPKTVAERVVVPNPHKTNWYALVNGELRFSTTRGPWGISEWRNFDWHTHVDEMHKFTRQEFRQWVVEHVEAEEREATGTCDSSKSVDGEVRGEDSATEVGETYESTNEELLLAWRAGHWLYS